MWNVNQCPKGIGLGTILETFYGKMIKQLIFPSTLIFLMKVVVKFSWYSLLTIALKAPVNITLKV